MNIKTSDLSFGVFPNSYAYVSGTSFAAPHLAGAMALLLNANSQAAVSELELTLTQSAVDLGPNGPDDDYGNGLMDVVEAYLLLGENPPQCTNADSDGYYAEAGYGTAQDCDDTDATIYPSALETKHDGIDQDCNGYDLTIDITKALYTAKKDTLSVEATSDLGKNANLECVDYGVMKWNNKQQNWTIFVRNAGGNLGVVTVSGVEGSETAQMTSK